MPQRWALAWTDQEDEYPPGKTRPRLGKGETRSADERSVACVPLSSSVVLAALMQRVNHSVGEERRI